MSSFADKFIKTKTTFPVDVSVTMAVDLQEKIKKRSKEIFSGHQQSVYQRTDRLFAVLLFVQWVAGIAAAYWISPKSWVGQFAQVHIHLWAAIFLGFFIISFPIYFVITRPGTVISRHSVAIAQMLTSALLIHLTGGRIETHFHVFGSLAFLAIYTDWKVLMTAAVVVGLDHVLRGVYWPQSVFGVIAASNWRWLEHAGWIVFENLFLIFACSRTVSDMLGIAHQRAQLEVVNENIERKVLERTAQLDRKNEELDQKNEQLASTVHELKASQDEMVQKNAELDRKNEEMDRKNEQLASTVGQLQRSQHEMEQKNRELAKVNDELVSSYKKADRIFSALAEALPGTVLDGKYQLDSKIGAGGFGAVYRATHLGLNRPIAVKVFRPTDDNASAENLDRFKMEGISTCRVNHPNAVSVLDSGISTEGIAYIVMELLEGHTLVDELQSEGNLSVERCAEIIIPVLDVLAEAHDSGIIHRDIKPDNIFLHQSKDGEVIKVVDFGIAKLMKKTHEFEPVTELTGTGGIVGTPTYMAPERLSNKPYDGRSDVYSVGILMYQMLSGCVPFDTMYSGIVGLILSHLKEDPPPIKDLNPNVPDKIERLVMSALEKDPNQRPLAREMAQNFADAIGIEYIPKRITANFAKVFRIDSKGFTLPNEVKAHIANDPTVDFQPVPEAENKAASLGTNSGSIIESTTK